MKRRKNLLIFFALLNMNFSMASEVINQQLVCHPDLTIAVNSFGNYINSQEIKVIPGYADRASKSQMLLLRWMQNSTPEGHLLRDIPEQNLFWQFVETKQYIGMILIIPTRVLDPRFYETLGSGGEVEGKYLYGYNAIKYPEDELISFVIDKRDLKMVHYENWKFMDETDSNGWQNSTICKNLVTVKELNALSPAYLNMLAGTKVDESAKQRSVLLDNTTLFHTFYPEKLEDNYFIEMEVLYVT